MQQKNGSCFSVNRSAAAFIIRTAIAATLVRVLYLFVLTDRNPCFACIGAVFGMGEEIIDGRITGGNRFYGTLLGGLTVLAVYPVYYGVHTALAEILVLPLGLLIILLGGHLVHRTGIIQPASVVYYVVLFTVATETFTSYTVARIIDTGLGVAISIGINVAWHAAQRYIAARNNTARAGSKITGGQTG